MCSPLGELSISEEGRPRIRISMGIIVSIKRVVGKHFAKYGRVYVSLVK